MTTVVRPADAAETATAVRDAVEAGLSISVRSGGHSGEAFANPDGVVIDLGSQTAIDVDGDLVTIGGGEVWGDVAVELARHGLALSSGDTKSVGVGGLTLGGGIGWMVRQHGLALDSLVSVEVVTASGEIVSANDRENPDLYWALRGGGGNFGVVTRFTFRAHPLEGVVLGTYGFDSENLGDVVTGWRDVMRSAPEQLNVTVSAMPGMGPDAPPQNFLTAVYAGTDNAAAAAAMAPLGSIAGITSEKVAPSAYADVLQDPPFAEPAAGGAPPPMPAIVDQNGFISDLTDDVIDDLVTLHGSLGNSVLMLRYLRGAFTRVETDATAFPHRDAEVLLISAAFLPTDAGSDAEVPLRAAWSAFEPHTAGMYGNFSPTVGDQITARMYPPATLDRLRTAKKRWDPQNVFAHNHNVAP